MHITSMMRLILLIAGLLAGPVCAASSDAHSSVALTARLITAEDRVAPGNGTLSAGLHLQMKEGWKTYWRSPGEVGLPPEIDWSASANIAETRLLYPAPTRFRAFGIENFGYEGEHVFPIRMRLDEAGAAARLHAEVFLLVCADVCIPDAFTLTLDLPAGTGPSTGIDTANAALIARHAARVPTTGSDTDLRITAAAITDDALTVTAATSLPFVAPDVFPELGAFSAFGAPDIRLSPDGREMWARLPVLARDSAAPPLAITITDGTRAASFEAVAVRDTPPAPPFDAATGTARRDGLVGIALVAMLGGLILNVMPCVLPVLSIKLGGALAQSGRERGHVRRGFIASALGVMAFFWVLAGVTASLQALGLSVGWGLQFQNPIFLAAMIALLTLFAANLAGLFEINLPQGLNTAMARSGGAGHAGDLAAGAFAAMLATPCSAPFLGTAVAFALTGGALEIAVIFTALGLGLASPYLLIAARPSLVQRLPKPGRWMGVVRGVMGLLLIATALWLAWVLVGVAGTGAAVSVLAALGIAGLALGLMRAGGARRGVVAALVASAVALPSVMRTEATAAPDLGTDWVAFDRSAIARDVSLGRVVFVDVTADWCLTCKANKTLVLNREPIASHLGRDDVTAMRADWTRPDESIRQYLETNGRFGIPFNTVYGPGAPDGIDLPELLTRERVEDALTEAAGG